MTDRTEANLERVLAETFGREPRLEKTGSVMGLIVQGSDSTHPYEGGMRKMALEATTASARNLVILGQARAGLTREGAEKLADDICTKTYESASQRTPYESERYQAVLKALAEEADALQHKTPLVTESQTNEIKATARSWTPERVLASEGRESTGKHDKRTTDQRIVDVLEGR